ncbi:hypothetical protein LTR17_025359 [Elasticomyces elasticus]|nr:hypothetical protein LTR17_025359 [Elasticomyces elasticus]
MASTSKPVATPAAAPKRGVLEPASKVATPARVLIDLDLVPDPRAENPANLAQWILDEQKLNHEISQLVQLYVAGDMLLDNRVMNEVIDELAIRSERMKDESCMFVDSAHIPYVWEHTGAESGLRTFMLDSCAARANLDPSDKETDPSDFFVELACRQMELRDCMSAEYNPMVSGRCQYHEHHGPGADAARQQCAKREKPAVTGGCQEAWCDQCCYWLL